jgi:arsenate reductase
MAEAYLKKYAGEIFITESAGLEAGTLNPFAIEAMKLEGVDISKNLTKSVFDFHKEGKHYDYVITVCDEASASACPVFPGVHKKINWSFLDPSQFSGTNEERLAMTLKVRDKIKTAVLNFIEEIKSK